MDWREHTRQVMESLADHPRRLIASAMGVFWGAVAIIVLMSFGTGFREYMLKELSGYGEGIVFVFPASTSSGFPGYRKGMRVKLSKEDAAAAERENADFVQAVLPQQSSRSRVLVEGGGRIRRLDMNAVDHRFAYYRNFKIGWGRLIDERDVQKRRPVAVIGIEAAEALFGSASAAIGERIRVDGRSFEVIGVPARKGRQYMNTNRPDNKLLLIPITTAEARLGFDEKEISGILLVPRKGVAAADAMNAVLRSLGPRAGFHPDDADAIKWFDTMIFTTLTRLLSSGFMIFIGIAGTVTLLIGAVGIANYHLATLAERTVEIAVCKALGARNGTLVAQTILESVTVSIGACGAGILFAVVACGLLGALIPAEDFPVPVVSIPVIAVTLVAVLAVAVIAATIPALRVRKMEISVALRASQ